MTYNQKIDREQVSCRLNPSVLYFRDSLTESRSLLLHVSRRDFSSRRYESVLHFLLLEEITILAQYKRVCVCVRGIYVSVHTDVTIGTDSFSPISAFSGSAVD